MPNRIFFYLSFFIVFLSSCSSDTDKSNNKSCNSIEIVIPEVFANDSLIKNHLTELSTNLDEFAYVVEDIADEIDAVGIKDIKKPTFKERLKLMKIVLPKVSPMMDKANKIQELDLISEKIKDTLTEEKKLAFEDFEAQFKLRFDTLNQRFQSYLSED